MSNSTKRQCLIIVFSILTQVLSAQFLMDMVDTTSETGKGLFNIYKNFNHFKVGGYIQPQFQWAQENGAASYNGGNFPAKSSTRFSLRRGRIRFDYARYSKENQPQLQFVFQFDGTERGVVIRDFWGRVWENKLKLFSVTAGMFARPFGYEVNLSSADRESPERGRMSQILMKTERDLGMMISLEPRGRKNFLQYVKLDVGVFNGQGLTGTFDYDNYKDFIGQIVLKPYPVSKNFFISAGVGYLNGGMRNFSKYVYHTDKDSSGVLTYVIDSTESNEGKRSPRTYYGAHMQLKVTHKWGATELRGEYWMGTQTGIETSSESQGAVPTDSKGVVLPFAVRQFNGVFVYLLQTIVKPNYQIGFKYDWYDPNMAVKGSDIGKAGSKLNAADVKYQTFSVGFNWYMNANFKMMLWYDVVLNEKTALTGYTKDLKDNVLTLRTQFRF